MDRNTKNSNKTRVQQNNNNIFNAVSVNKISASNSQNQSNRLSVNTSSQNNDTNQATLPSLSKFTILLLP